MKKSIVFFIIMAFGIVTGMTSYNFALKKQYDEIDKKDPFWDFEQNEALNFSNIVIEGSNLVEFRIIRVQDRRPGIALKKTIKDLVRYEIKENTLFIKVNKKMITNTSYKYAHQVEGIIFFRNIKNITLHNISTSIEISQQQVELSVSASGESNIKFRTTRSQIQNLSIDLRDKAVASFQNKVLLPELYISLKDSSSLDLKDVLVQKQALEIKDKATITMDANLWNIIEKQQCNLCSDTTLETMP